MCSYGKKSCHVVNPPLLWLDLVALTQHCLGRIVDCSWTTSDSESNSTCKPHV